jgi:transcriptional regulator of heat shock response
MKMNPRSADILRAVVRDFIASGEPISSEFLFRAHDFGIRPAMIRLELNDLTEQGYLEQPHHASGRIPSDRGYEFYVEQVLAEPETKVSPHWTELFDRAAWPELVSDLSEEFGVVGAAMTERHGLVFKGFLENLVDHLEWDSRMEIKSIIRDFEELDERLAAAKRLMANEDFLKVFIGKNPIARSEQLSVMVADYEVDGERVFLCTIGPKRMDYEKSSNILKGLKKKTETP